MRTTAFLFAILSAAALAPIQRARAGALDLSIGIDAGDSEWDDHVSDGTFKLGYRFWRPWFEVVYLGKLGYANVDDRVLTYLSLGIEARPPIDTWRVRPYARAALVHQHEENRSSIDAQPWQSALGVGDGIRHRGGAMAALGLEIPFHDHAHGDWYAAIEADGTYFPDDRGPHRYLSVGASVGFNWDFAAPRASASANEPRAAAATVAREDDRAR
jgi:hypothetical protein